MTTLHHFEILLEEEADSYVIPLPPFSTETDVTRFQRLCLLGNVERVKEHLKTQNNELEKAG